MQEKPLLDILALMFALGLPLADALFPDSPEEAISAAHPVSTEEELLAALRNPEISHILLQNDVVTVTSLAVNRDLTLDLGGFKITSVQPEIRVIDLKYGHLALTGQGGIVAYGVGAAAIRIHGATTADNSNYATLTVDRDVRLYAPHFYGIFITPNFNAAYGVTIDFRGTIIARDGICINSHIIGSGENSPVIKIADTANITVDENEGVALYAAGFGLWRIGAAKITGAVGLSVKSGLIRLDNTQIITTGVMTDPASWTDQIQTGAVFQIESPLPGLTTEITVSGGDYTSIQSYVVAEHHPRSTPDHQSLTLEAGNFMGRLGVFYGVAPRSAESANTKVLGGLYNADVTAYLASSRHLEKRREHGVYNVIDDTEQEIVIDEATLVANARIDLGILLEKSEYYITGKYVSGELGDWQPRLTKLIINAKRAKTIAKKALRSSNDLDKLTSVSQSLERAVENIRLLGDELRTELASAVASVEAIDPHDYSDYSYGEVVTVQKTASALLDTENPTLESLYSALLDIEINIDLLESRETDMEETVDQLLTSSISAAVDAAAPPPPPPPLVAPTSSAPSAIPPVAESALEPAPDTTELVDYASELSSDTLSNYSSSLDENAEPVDPDTLTLASSLAVVQMLQLAETSDEALLPDPERESGPFIDGAMELLATTLLSEPILPASTEDQRISQLVRYDNQEFKTAEQSLRHLLNAISALDPDEYTASSYAILANAATHAGNLLLDRPNLSLELLHSTFDNVKMVYHNLVKKSNYPEIAALEEAKNNLRSMLDAVRDLAVQDYNPESAEQFGELQVAIAKANALLVKPNLVLSDILHIMDEINHTTTGLKGSAIVPTPTLQPQASAPSQASSPSASLNPPASSVAPPIALNWSDLREVVADISTLTPDDYTTDSYAKVLSGLERAKSLLRNPKATQSTIDDLVFDLNLALLALEPSAPLSNALSSSFLSSAPTAPASQPGTTALSSSEVMSLSSNSVTSAPLDPAVTPNLLMSMMAGAYAGLATYRKSRLAAKTRVKHKYDHKYHASA